MKVDVVYTNSEVKSFNDVVVYTIDSDFNFDFSLRLGNGETFGHTLFVLDKIIIDGFTKWSSKTGMLYDDEEGR